MPFPFSLPTSHYFPRISTFLQEHPSGYVKAIPLENDLKSFKALVKARADYAHKIERLVRERNLPMAFLANQLSLSPFRVWLGLIHHSKLHVHMAYGTVEEQARENNNALNQQPVCVDVFGLLSLKLLGELELLPKLYPKVLAHISTLESIAQDIHELEGTRPAFHISYQDGHFIRSEISAEHFEFWRLFLSDIRDFLKSSSVELISLSPEAVNIKGTKESREVLGAVCYDPVLVAQELKTSFFGDDASTRSLAWTEHRIPTICTQALLRCARQKGILTAAEYEDGVLKLLRHNYHFVSESGESLFRLAQTDKFQISDFARKLIGRSLEEGIDKSASIRILSEFTFLLWTADSTETGASRDEWLKICAQVLLQANEPERTLPQFLSFLAIRCFHTPFVFGGITHCMLLRGKLSRFERLVFHLAMHSATSQIINLVPLQFPWSPELRKNWLELARLNFILYANDWL